MVLEGACLQCLSVLNVPKRYYNVAHSFLENAEVIFTIFDHFNDNRMFDAARVLNSTVEARKNTFFINRTLNAYNIRCYKLRINFDSNDFSSLLTRFVFAMC